MRTLLFIVSLFVLMSQTYAQNPSFNIKYDSDHSFFLPPCISPTPDQGTIVGATRLEDDSEAPALVIKKDQYGFLEWTLEIGEPNYVLSTRHVLATTDSAYILLLTRRTHINDASSRLVMVKVDHSGNELWSVVTNLRPSYHDIDAVITEDNEVFIVTKTQSTGEIQLSKFDDNSNLIWSKKKTVSGLSLHEPRVQIYGNDSVLVLTRNNSFDPPLLMVFKQVSGFMTRLIKPNLYQSRTHEIAVDDDLNMYLGGFYYSNLSNDVWRYYTMKIDTADSIHWVHSYKTPGHQDYITQMTLDGTGNPVFAGFSNNTNFSGLNVTMHIAKLDASTGLIDTAFYFYDNQYTDLSLTYRDQMDVFEMFMINDDNCRHKRFNPENGACYLTPYQLITDSLSAQIDPLYLGQFSNASVSVDSHNLSFDFVNQTQQFSCPGCQTVSADFTLSTSGLSVSAGALDLTPNDVWTLDSTQQAVGDSFQTTFSNNGAHTLLHQVYSVCGVDSSIQWFEVCDSVQASFTYLSDSSGYHFTSTDTSANDLFWFVQGDTFDTTSQIFVPHSEDSTEVCLVIKSDCTADTHCVTLDPVGVFDTGLDKSFSFYPNPAHSVLHISVDNNFTGTINIYNALGQQELQQQLNASLTSIDVSGLPAGIYFLELEDIEKASGKKSFLILPE